MDEENNGQSVEEQNAIEELEQNEKRQEEQATKDAVRDAQRKITEQVGDKVSVSIKKYIVAFVIANLPIIMIIVIIGSLLFFVAHYLFENEMSNIANNMENQKDEYVTIGDYGPEFIPKDLMDMINQYLKDNNIEKKDLHLGTDEQADAYLCKFMLAALSTELPYIEGSSAPKIKDIIHNIPSFLYSKNPQQIQGIVHMKRQMRDKDDKIDLKYIKHDDLIKMMEEDSKNKTKKSLEYFSLDDSWMLCIATYVDQLDPDSEEILSSSVTEVKVPYKTMISQYAMPFNFFLTLQRFTQNAEYVSAVADMVAEEGYIELTMFDNVETVKYEYFCDYTLHRRAYVDVPVDANNPEAGTYKQLQNSASKQHEEIRTKTRTNTVKANVTKANVWVIEQETSYTKKITTEYPYGPDGKKEGPKDEGSDPGAGIEGTWITDKTELTKEERVKEEWLPGATATNINASEFLGMWRNEYGHYEKGAPYVPPAKGKLVKYPLPPTGLTYLSPIETLYSAEDMFYQILQNSENTQNHAIIMKYLVAVYKTGLPLDQVDIELDLDLSIYNPTEIVARPFSGYGGGGDFDVHDESLFITDAAQLEAAFRGGYSENSQLLAHVQDFLNMQEKYKVNAIFAAAVSITETTAGTRGHAVDGLNNWFNLDGTDGPYKRIGSHNWRIYSSAAEGIDAFGAWIVNHYYNVGLYTVDPIGHKFCPNEEVPGQAEKWVESTMARIAQFYSAAGIDINSFIGQANSGVPQDLGSLFPNGIPTNESEMQQYLTTVTIPINDSNGNASTSTVTIHKALANNVIAIFTEIQKSGFKIKEVGGYSWRGMAGGSSRSHHSYGVAIDINPNENCMIKNGSVIAGSFWKPGENEYSITPDGPVVKAFAKYGWTWGGTWKSSKDYMHFSITGH